MSASSATISTTNNQRPNIYKISVTLLKNNTKDVLKTIRNIFEWLAFFFKSLAGNPAIKNTLALVKSGEKALVFGEFTQSILNSLEVITYKIHDGIINAIIRLTRSLLDLMWGFAKVCKSLCKYEIVNLPIGVFSKLVGFGGTALAISSADRVISSTQNLSTLDQNKKDYNAHAFFYLNVIAKNIGTLAIGIITALKYLAGFVTPEFYMLAIGTIVVVSTIASSIMKETYNLTDTPPCHFTAPALLMLALGAGIAVSKLV